MTFTFPSSLETTILSNIPILTKVLGVSEEVSSCDCENAYHTFEFRHRKGRKSRTIDAPCPHLKTVQRALLDKILSAVDPHDAAMGFISGKSIAANARLHLGAPYLFQTDIQSFFPSISHDLVENMLRLRLSHLSADVQKEILLVVTVDGHLPQGAPTSPHISNLVMHGFDANCEEAADRLGAVYTRYADDISISGREPESLRQMESVVKLGLESLNMTMHPRKTRHLGPHQTKLVTGLEISGARIRPSKAFRKKTAALVRMAIKYPTEFESHQDLIGGYLAFWFDVDPTDRVLPDLLEGMGWSNWAKKARRTWLGKSPIS